jgi:hypothetical protein
MKSREKRWLAAAVTVVLAIMALTVRERTKSHGTRGEEPSVIRVRTSQPDFSKEEQAADAAARKRVLNDWKELVEWLDAEPRPANHEIRARLLALRFAWTEMDPQVLAEMLHKLLESGGDRMTGLDFEVGPHGFLKGWSSLRVFLLDILATSDPEMAAEIAKGVLGETASADEFAIALRSLTREGTEATDAELSALFGKMLGRSEWGSSAGFAEAFDLVRWVGSPEIASQLVSWNGNPALKSMAMDEFAAEHPGVMLEVLAAGNSLTGIACANLMARADPVDPKQMAIVDAYLRSQDRSPEEAAAFLQAFPLRSATTGYRLYGETPAPYRYAQIVAGDRAAYEQVRQWANDPLLEKFRTDLNVLQNRLATWIEETR